MGGLGLGGPSAAELAFHPCFVKQIHSSPSQSCLVLHHESPGCYSCDWIIYNSNLTFLTRQHHTKGKVMKSHLSHMSLTPSCRAFQKPLWLREGRERPTSPRPARFPLPPSFCQSSTYSPLPLHSLADTSPHGFSLSHTHFLTDADTSAPSLPLSSPCLHPSCPRDILHAALPLFFHCHDCLPV